MNKFTAEDARYMQPKNRAKLMLKECLEEVSKAASNDFDTCVYNGEPLPYVDNNVDEKDRAVSQLIRDLKALGFEVTIRNPSALYRGEPVTTTYSYGIGISWKET